MRFGYLTYVEGAFDWLRWTFRSCPSTTYALEEGEGRRTVLEKRNKMRVSGLSGGPGNKAYLDPPIRSISNLIRGEKGLTQIIYIMIIQIFVSLNNKFFHMNIT